MTTKKIINRLIPLLFVVPIISCQSADEVDNGEDEITGNDNSRSDETEWVATIDVNDYYGRVISKHFYDLKTHNGKFYYDADYIEEHNLMGFRVPFYGEDSKPAHPSEGEVVSSYYDNLVASITSVKESYPDFVIFASKKLDGKTSFPDWVKDDDGIIPEKYHIMLYDFINHVYDRGVEIDVLGIDNEEKCNEGDITAEKYFQTIMLLKERLVEENRNRSADRQFKIPQFIGPDQFSVSNNNGSNGELASTDYYYQNYWMWKLMTTHDEERGIPWSDALDIYGVHYYETARSGQYVALTIDLELKGDREFWATEPHWDNSLRSQYTDYFQYSCECVAGVWDMTDIGLDNIIWWGYYGHLSTIKGTMQKAMTLPIIGAQPVMVVDHDGWAILEKQANSTYTSDVFDTSLQTRAFRNGRNVVLYAINMCPNTDENPNYTNYEFKIEGANLFGIAEMTQWRDDTFESDEVVESSEEYLRINEGETKLIATQGNSIFIDMPSRSFTMVQFVIDEI